MIEYLKERLKNSSGFYLDIRLKTGTRLSSVGLCDIDNIGVVVKDPDKSPHKFCVPWTSIVYFEVIEC